MKRMQLWSLIWPYLKLAYNYKSLYDCETYVHFLGYVFILLWTSNYLHLYFSPLVIFCQTLFLFHFTHTICMYTLNYLSKHITLVSFILQFSFAFAISWKYFFPCIDNYTWDTYFNEKILNYDLLKKYCGDPRVIVIINVLVMKNGEKYAWANS